MKVAALDLGTNTFLCLIAEVDASGVTKIYKDLSKVVRLGQDIDKTGDFHPEAINRARVCLQEFKHEIELEKVDRTLAMATSAARDAKNGSELFKIGKELNIPIEIIPGEDEARITYFGATAGFPNSNETTLVIDVGGGSTELIVGEGCNIRMGLSLNIGGVRLTDRFISTQPVIENERKQMKEYIKSQIHDVVDQLRQEDIRHVVAVAGTPTSLAALELGGFDEKKVDGFFLKKDRLAFWVQEFGNTTVEEKKNKYQLGGRADIIFAGASILLELVENLNLAGLTVTTKGVRYGVALEIFKAKDAF
jgi:exopolyphosphatase/guanosine-5'-triphosphate,3'-diphosphate pyrophosphatase